MKVTRRHFLEISAGVIGTAAAAQGAVPGADPSVAEGLPGRTANPEIKTGRQVPSICPFCSVGCAVLVMVDDAGGIVDIQGNPDSPINEGTLCPKGAASYQLVANDLRWTKVKYRAPGSDHWEERSLTWAMDRVATLVKEARDAHFNEYEEIPDSSRGRVKKRVMNTYAVASLGGAVIDNEWNYLQQKLMHGLGVVYVENQARI